MPFSSHEEYFDGCTAEARGLLLRIQHEVETQVPDAIRCIGYQMPAFRQRKVFFYFAALKNHIGIYPPLTDDPALVVETARFRGPKGNLSFPYGEELPLALIGRVARALSVQYSKPPAERR